MFTVSRYVATLASLSCLAACPFLLTGCGSSNAAAGPPIARTAVAVETAAPNSNSVKTPCEKQGVTFPPNAVPPPAKLSGVMPLGPYFKFFPPNFTESQGPAGNRPLVDQFSWQSFIALNWPAKADGPPGVPDEPGNPEKFLNAPNGTPTVWGTFKEAFELFGQQDKPPYPWDEKKVHYTPPGMIYGPKMFYHANKGTNLLTGGANLNEAFSLPLIDQQLNYVYTEVRFNKAFYEWVREKKLYLIENLANAQPVSLPTSSVPPWNKGATPPYKLGAIMVKATWKIITKVDDSSRYYCVKSLLYDPETNSPREQLMGLVGLHIAHKTHFFTQWVWSSFEQVDNVERGHGLPETSTPSFNNGTNDPPTVGGYANRPKKPIPPMQRKSERVAVQVSRYNAIPTSPEPSTVTLNQRYRKLLKGTVWEHYQLVITNWPTESVVPDGFCQPIPPKFKFKTIEEGGLFPDNCCQPVPRTGATNTVLETYFQSPADADGAFGNSCMSCHYVAGKSDFSWVLQLRAHTGKGDQ